MYEIKGALKRIWQGVASWFTTMVEGEDLSEVSDASIKPYTMLIRFNDEATDAIDEVAEMTGASTPDEVLRRALTLYDALIHETAKGAVVELHFPDGTAKEVMLVF